MSIEGTKIVNNLKGRVHAVNSAVALSGIQDNDRGFRALRQLIEADIVIEESINLPDGSTGKLYRHNQFRAGLQPRSAIRPVK